MVMPKKIFESELHRRLASTGADHRLGRRRRWLALPALALLVCSCAVSTHRKSHETNDATVTTTPDPHGPDGSDPHRPEWTDPSDEGGWDTTVRVDQGGFDWAAPDAAPPDWWQREESAPDNGRVDMADQWPPPPDVSGPDSVVPDVTGPAPWQPLDCGLAWHWCSTPLPGCFYTEQCPTLPDCPVSGCGTDGPELQYVYVGTDACDEAYVLLGSADGRLAAGNVHDLAAQYDPAAVQFDVLLDGRRTTHCMVESLPTGAIRYQLSCFQDDGTIAYVAVLEEWNDGSCPTCPDVTGCYHLDLDPIVCDSILACVSTPQRVRISANWDCNVELRFEEPPAPAQQGWVSYDGLLNVHASSNGMDVWCSFIPTETGFANPVCSQSGSVGPSSLPVSITLTRIDDPTCALPQCISNDSCAAAAIGDRCVQGQCVSDL